MTIQFEDSSALNYANRRSRRFFVRLQNLPWSASPRDIKIFFQGLYVPQGGISIQGKNAFVSFENWEEILAAMLRDKHTIHGEQILLSIVELNEVRMLTDRHIQRNLYLLSKCQTPNNDSTSTPGPSSERRTIRPTAITSIDDPNFERNPAFSPDEINTPVSSYAGTRGWKSFCKPTKRPRLCYRKITPTSVLDIREFLSVFSPLALKRIPVRRGIKKLRLDYS